MLILNWTLQCDHDSVVVLCKNLSDEPLPQTLVDMCFCHMLVLLLLCYFCGHTWISIVPTGRMASISLPPALFRSTYCRHYKGTTGVFFSVYKLPHLFPVANSNISSGRTRSVGSFITGTTVDRNIEIIDVDPPITVTLTLQNPKNVTNTVTYWSVMRLLLHNQINDLKPRQVLNWSKKMESSHRN